MKEYFKKFSKLIDRCLRFGGVYYNKFTSYLKKLYIIHYQVALTTRGEDEEDNKILNRELTPLKKINGNYPKYILTLDADFDGIKKINVLDWLLW